LSGSTWSSPAACAAIAVIETPMMPMPAAMLAAEIPLGATPAGARTPVASSASCAHDGQPDASDGRSQFAGMVDRRVAE
jgi:hypothetical protein